MSVNPIDGGNSLRFSRLDASANTEKDVRIRVSNSDSHSYQVFQRMLEPLVNEQGQTLDSQAVYFYGQVGSNGFGTLYGQIQERVTVSDTLVYSSSQNGDSDGFTLVYGIDPARIDRSGKFQGKVLINVRPRSGAAARDVILNIYVDVDDKFQSSVTGSTGASGVTVRTDDLDGPADFVHIVFSGNIGNQVRISQEVVTWPKNSQGDDLVKDVFQFYVEGQNRQNIRVPEPELLSARWRELYSGENSEDDVYVYFPLAAGGRERLKAGTYRGAVNYVIETGGLRQEYPVDLTIEVLPVFAVQIEFPGGSMHFSQVLPNSPPQEREATVTVSTNLGRPYQVLQNVKALLRNEDGEEIAKDYFAFRIELSDTDKGSTPSAGFRAVGPGEEVLYMSDALGSPRQFRVFYRLRPYPGMPSGNFSSEIVYTLGEI